MKYAIWTLQVVLALVFIGAGVTKLITPISDLAANMAWTMQVPAVLVRFSGLAELAGGLGLILPWVTGIQPQLVRIAALGLVVTMIGAIITHLVIGDPVSQLIPPLALGTLASVLAYSRTKVMPLPAVA